MTKHYTLTLAALILLLSAFASATVANAQLAPNFVRPRLPNEQPAPRVVFIGDQVTSNWPLPYPWTNAAVSGQTSTETLAGLQTVLNTHPQIIHLITGTADSMFVGAHQGPAGTPTVEPDTTIANIQQIITECQNAGVGIIVGTPPPDQDGNDYDELSAYFVYQWITLQMTNTTGATMANYESVLVPSDCLTDPSLLGPGCGWAEGLTVNGIVPDAAGYAAMDPLAYQAITIVASSLKNGPG